MRPARLRRNELVRAHAAYSLILTGLEKRERAAVIRGFEPLHGVVEIILIAVIEGDRIGGADDRSLSGNDDSQREKQHANTDAESSH